MFCFALPAHAVRLVQQKTCAGINTGDLSCSFDSTTTAGNLIILVIVETSDVGGRAPLASITDFTLAGVNGAGDGAKTQITSIFYRANAPASTGVYAANVHAADWTYTMFEVANMYTSSPLHTFSWGKHTNGFVWYSGLNAIGGSTTTVDNTFIVVGASVDSSIATVSWNELDNRGKIEVYDSPVDGMVHSVAYTIKPLSGARVDLGDAVYLGDGSTRYTVGAIASFRGYAEPIGPDAGVVMSMMGD